MERLSDENIRGLIEVNQIAIIQLGEDIKELDKKLNKNTMMLSKTMQSVQRDIKDRWQYLSDMTKELEKIVKGDTHAKKKPKN